MKKQAMKQKVLKKDLVPMLSWQIQEIVVKFNLHKKESKLLPTEQMFPKKELLFREERVLKNVMATLSQRFLKKDQVFQQESVIKRLRMMQVIKY